MQPITILGLALCLAMLYRRAQRARNQPPSSGKKRLKTAHMLVGVLLAWLMISFNLSHLNHALSGDAEEQPSTWERVVKVLHEWME